MAKNNNLTDFLTSLADCLRRNFAMLRNAPVNPQDMESIIDYGVASEKETGREEGRYQGLEAGKREEYNNFWDAFQNYGNRKNYWYAFADGDLSNRGWNNTTLKPKYDLILNNAELMFRGCGYEGSLTELLNRQGITIETRGCTGNAVNNMFAYSKFTEIPFLDFSNLSYMSQTFTGSLIETISIRVGEYVNWNGTFNDCSKLKNLTIIGTTGRNGLNVSYSPLLTHDSLMGIINALKDYSGSGTTYTCTLGINNLQKLTDAEIQQATNKGWTLA